MLFRSGLHRLVAILSPDNTRSSNLLERLGFRFECMIVLHEEALKLYAMSM